MYYSTNNILTNTFLSINKKIHTRLLDFWLWAEDLLPRLRKFSIFLVYKFLRTFATIIPLRTTTNKYLRLRDSYLEELEEATNETFRETSKKIFETHNTLIAFFYSLLWFVVRHATVVFLVIKLTSVVSKQRFFWNLNIYLSNTLFKDVTILYSFINYNPFVDILGSKPWIYLNNLFSLWPNFFSSNEKRLQPIHFLRYLRGVFFFPQYACLINVSIPRALYPIIVATLFLSYSCISQKITFLRIVGGWLLVLFFAYWLISGFNHFLKRYKFGSFTSAIQRFWKRAYMCFWMIEGFVFLLFFYYTLNSSQEPTFMLDQVWLCNKQIWSLKAYMLTFSLIISCILLLNILTLQLKFNTFRQSIPTTLVCTFIFIYFLFGESYQFYYIVNFYDDCVFVFSPEEHVWELESDSPRTRTRNSYFTLTILARFWHYIFIFIGWVFFLSKIVEYRRIRYAFLSFNTQNFIIFYILAWLSMSNWLKWIFRRFMDLPYYWFLSDYRQSGVSLIGCSFRVYTVALQTSLLVFFAILYYLQLFFVYSFSQFKLAYGNDSMTRHKIIPLEEHNEIWRSVAREAIINNNLNTHRFWSAFVYPFTSLFNKYDYTFFSGFSYGRGTYLEYYLSQYM